MFAKALSLLELKRLDHFKPTKVDLSSADSNLFSQGKNSNMHEQNSNNEVLYYHNTFYHS